MEQCSSPGGNVFGNLENLTIDEGISLIQTQRVNPLLRYLKYDEYNEKTNLSFVVAYSVVVQFGDDPTNSRALYDYYRMVITNFCKDSIFEFDNISGMDFLTAVQTLWKKQTILVFWMQRMFQYLDRFLTKCNTETPPLFVCGLNCFHNIIYKPLANKISAYFVEAVNNERDGSLVDASVLKNLVEMFCTVGNEDAQVCKSKDDRGDHIYWTNKTKGRYEKDLERSILEATKSYYHQKLPRWLSEFTCVEYLNQVNRRLRDEMKRTGDYLDGSTADKLLNLVETTLIMEPAQRVAEMETGCASMLRMKRYEDLKTMFQLLSRCPGTLNHMTSIMQPYVESRVNAITNDRVKIENPEEYITDLIGLQKELESMVEGCFNRNSSFQLATNKGLENVLNKDTRCAKYVAVYSDIQLRKGLKGKNEHEIKEFVDSIIRLFVHIKDKDVFLEVYKERLSKRLLNQLSISDDAEELVIAKLKVETGQQSVSKLMSLFQSVATSAVLQEEFQKELPHKGSPAGIQMDVKVLQSNSWHEKQEYDHCVVPSSLRTCTTVYTSFYLKKHQGRRLHWMYNLGQAEVAASCFKRKHSLHVSTFQAVLLYLFNSCDTLTFKEIKDASKIPEHELKRQLLSLTPAKQKILKKDGPAKEIDDACTFKVNREFQTDKLKVQIRMIVVETEKNEVIAPSEAPLERKHIVDAVIVRIMKARKLLKHNDLLEEVYKQCQLFKPQVNKCSTI
eukprot:GHVL01003944.1.p1 GENE.GHVL01003944.1~~GHVL01003944.1.p1  ORF type:complete len:732 (-),score=100.48 GHVL01003944.1:1221-3416(-)